MLVFVSVMPSGVEHGSSRSGKCTYGTHVFVSVMPSGVEHWIRGDCRYRLPVVFVSVMPSGVEHAHTSPGETSTCRCLFP